MSLLRGFLGGAAAGAAGTTALNAVSYLGMALKGRPASSTPQATVEKLADVAQLTIPGSDVVRKNRIAGIGPMTGVIVGVGVGALLGLFRSAGWRPAPVMSGLAATVGALIGGNVPMTVLGVTDPRTWTAKDWASDIAPHWHMGLLSPLPCGASGGKRRPAERAVPVNGSR
ncbi:hypothetical protein SAMN05216368_10862 [Cryobacterium flavum]|uniref:Uncharacterized protein n=1 Tax=Cryobacterium flavum TaxID=1424659 RepID=A0A5E9G280_9MICO|nr:hypothetical protein [Cryobacterium flavum]SDN90340.1 hypothetical protein SAMN05216368_10862 [Cryobacterium flavum]